MTRWPRTRQPGPRPTDRGPGRAVLMFVIRAQYLQTPGDQEHKHKHGHQVQGSRTRQHGPSTRQHGPRPRQPGPAAAAHDTRATRQASVGRLRWPSSGSHQGGGFPRHKHADPMGGRCDTRHKKTRRAAGFGSGESGHARRASRPARPARPGPGRPGPGRGPGRRRRARPPRPGAAG